MTTTDIAQGSRVYDFEVTSIDQKQHLMSKYRGKVLLIVNTASRCGFTPQYKALEALYQRFKDKNFEILAFPCNQFGGQEPGDNEEIRQFCELSYGVTFPIFAKIEVNGEGAHPLFKYLKSEALGVLGTEAIKWNFTKFLVDGEGHVVERYAPKDNPMDIEARIEEMLQ